jgi:LPXTG-site transpeptidase (sortase) family protein
MPPMTMISRHISGVVRAAVLVFTALLASVVMLVPTGPARAQDAAPTPIPTVDVAAALAQYAQAFPAPDHIWIDKIRVNAKIEQVGPGKVIEGATVEWATPNSRAVGWHNNSGRMGEGRNIVLNGHNNIYGAIFRKLYTLKPGDTIRLGAGDLIKTYRVKEVTRVAERDLSVAERAASAARFINPAEDDRLTIVSCWPEWSNSHRVYVVARPVAAAAP